jgi:hypothetical protein
MKAYHVFDVDGEIHEVIFAETRGKAIRKSEAYFATGDWTAVRARRAPEFDPYFDKPIPDEVYLKAGWSLECPRYYKPVTEDDALLVEDVAYCEDCGQLMRGSA